MVEFSPDIWRLIIFIALLAVFASAEAAFPKKARTQPRSIRWMTNAGFVLINNLVLRLIGPLSAIAVAAWAHASGWGLLGQIDLPPAAELIFALILLDLGIYAQHVAFHKFSFFWRFHKVHHADRDIDVTTGIRFHPAEIIFSLMYKCLLVVVIGPGAIAFVIFEIILNGTSLFNHANLKLPVWLDRLLRTFIVTPDMHRVHHSTLNSETNSNFGFNLPYWDYVFRTYRPQPKAGHTDVRIGLADQQTSNPSKLSWSLIFPFRH